MTIAKCAFKRRPKPPRFGQPEDPSLTDAAGWAVESRLASLQAEIAMLDQELLSHRQRVDLLRAQREEAELGSSRISQRVEQLRSISNERRGLQAEIAIEQATQSVASQSAAQQASIDQQMTNFRNAFGACLEANEYVARS